MGGMDFLMEEFRGGIVFLKLPDSGEQTGTEENKKPAKHLVF